MSPMSQPKPCDSGAPNLFGFAPPGSALSRFRIWPRVAGLWELVRVRAEALRARPYGPPGPARTCRSGCALAPGPWRQTEQVGRRASVCVCRFTLIGLCGSTWGAPHISHAPSAALLGPPCNKHDHDHDNISAPVRIWRADMRMWLSVAGRTRSPREPKAADLLHIWPNPLA